MNRHWQLWRITWLSGLLLTGCESSHPIGTLDSPQLDPSPYQIIGKIIQINPSSGTVVVRLERQDTSLQNEVYVRDNKLKTVATLKPTGIRTGHSVGMVITRGNPEIGQKVVQKTNT